MRRGRTFLSFHRNWEDEEEGEVMRKMKRRTFLSFVVTGRMKREGRRMLFACFHRREPVNCQNLQIVRVRDV